MSFSVNPENFCFIGEQHFASALLVPGSDDVLVTLFEIGNGEVEVVGVESFPVDVDLETVAKEMLAGHESPAGRHGSALNAEADDHCEIFSDPAFLFLRDKGEEYAESPFLLGVFDPISKHYHRFALESTCPESGSTALWHDLNELKGLRSLLDRVIAAEEAR